MIRSSLCITFADYSNQHNTELQQSDSFLQILEQFLLMIFEED